MNLNVSKEAKHEQLNLKAPNETKKRDTADKSNEMSLRVSDEASAD